MTNYTEIIKLLEQIEIKEDNIPIEFVNMIIKIRKKINKFEIPIFTKDGISMMKNWDEFKYSGLSNIDYVMTEFWDIGI